MLKSKFLAGLIATLITIVLIVGLAVLAVLVFGLTAENKALTYGGAFGAIAIWGGIYSWLKPKDQEPPQQDQYKDGELPTRHS